MAVDIESGRYGMATPPNIIQRTASIPPSAFRKDGDGYDLLSLNVANADVLCVRPGKAAWTRRETDGGAADADHLFNGKLSFAASQMEPARHSEELRKLQNKDVIVVIVPGDLTVLTAEVAP